VSAAASARLVPRSDVVLSRTGDEALLLDEAGGKVHVVNHTAARLWELCADAPTLDELVDSMAAAYEIDRGAISADVASMVATFSELGLFASAPPA